AGTLRFPGPAYGAAWVPGPDPATVVAVGPGGADVSYDWGQTWTALSDQEFWAVAFHSREAGWMVGPQGRIVRVELPWPGSPGIARRPSPVITPVPRFAATVGRRCARA